MSDTKTRTDCGFCVICGQCGSLPFISDTRKEAFFYAYEHVRETGHRVAVIPCNIVSVGEPE